MTRCKRISRKICDMDNSFFPVTEIEKTDVSVRGSVLRDLDHTELVMKITKAGPRMDLDFYTLAPRQSYVHTHKKHDADKSALKARWQIDRNIKHSRKRLEQLLEANFIPGKDYAITLSFREEVNRERVKELLNNFFDRVRRLRKKLLNKAERKLKYIYSINTDEGHRIHVHIVLNGGISLDEIRKAWGKGNTHIQWLEPYDGIEGAAKYLYEQNEEAKRQGKHIKIRMWTPSRGLKQPEEYWCYPNLRMKKLAREEYAIRENCEKYFPSYTYQIHKPYVSIIHESFCMNITLRKKDAYLLKDQLHESVSPLLKHEENPEIKQKQLSKARRKTVTVNSNYMFTYDGKHYSMPAMYKGRRLKVLAYDQYLEIYDNDVLVRTWARSYEDDWMIEPSDIPHDWNNYRYYSWADKIGTATRTYVEALIMRYRYPVEAYRFVQGILRISKDYDYSVFDASCRKALARKTFSYSGFIRLLNECRDLWVDGILQKEHCKGKERFEQLNLFGYIDSTNNE